MHLGRDAALGERVQRAGEARERARRRRRPPTARAHVDADRVGAQRRVAAGAQRVAERREQHAAHSAQTPADADDQRQVVVGRLRAEPARRPDADQAVAAAGERVPLEHHRPGDLRERERQHGEVHARQPHAEPAEHAARRARRRAAPASSAGFHRPAGRLAAAAPRHRRPGRSRPRGRTMPCRPAP